MPGEKDPSGLQPGEPGAKLDEGKVRVSLMMSGFPRALMEVAKVATFGANKYCDDGWMSVVEGEKRYADAGLRHFLKAAAGEELDQDSGLLHLSHEAWNVLARLELYLRRS